jgi:hypothetical protein
LRSMQNPASPPPLKRTCPSCKRPVETDDKFCEACGTPVPDLSACSICGTQFVVPVNYCEVCGAPVNPGIEPEPDGSPEHPLRNPGDVEDQLPEQQREEIPEPDTDELPDENEIITPDKDNPPRFETEEIQEPDTDRLLEQFGSGYRADETLESYRKAKSETIDDPLFFSQVRPKAPEQPRGNRTMLIGGFFALTAIIAVVFFIGLPLLAGTGSNSTHSNQTMAGNTTIPTSVGTIRPVQVNTTAPVPKSLIPMPTQLIPSGQKLYFQVRKDPVTTKISVIFAGSAGEGSIKSADIRVTHQDGSIATGIIQPLKGVTEITLGGSNVTDRVEILAQMSNGVTYRVYDELVP